MSNFDLLPAFRENQLSEVLKPTIDYSFMFYQLGTISMLHSQEMRQLIESFKDRLTNQQATNILASIDLSEGPEGNYLVKTQLDILRRHLPTQKLFLS